MYQWLVGIHTLQSIIPNHIQVPKRASPFIHTCQTTLGKISEIPEMTYGKMYFGQHHDLLQQLWAMQPMHPHMLPTGLHNVKGIRKFPEGLTLLEMNYGGQNQGYMVHGHSLMYPLLQ